MPCALVLSAGGMFGAYQAGAWKALAGTLQPDFIVGASAGALNTWAIAGGCSPAELCSIWTNRDTADLMRLRKPLRPWRGIFDSEPVYRQLDELWARFRPILPCAITLVQMPRLRPVFVTSDRITAAHLRASCAIPLGYPPVRIDGKYFVDGGLLGPVPLWAAAEMGATSVVIVNALEFMPSLWLRAGVGALRAVFAPKNQFQNIEVTWIRPSTPLGALHDALFWNEENARRWIAQGERDAAAVLTGATLANRTY